MKNSDVTAANENKAVESLREPFRYEIAPTDLINPIDVMRDIYNRATSKERKQACIRYLLHYQHYNADYTPDEIKYLHYSNPLYQPQKKPSYTRTNSSLLKLLNPWIERSLKKEAEFLRLGTLLSIDVIKFFYQSKLSDVEFVFLPGDALEGDYRKVIKSKNPIKLFFYRVSEAIDCLLIWGAENTSHGLVFKKIDYFFDEKVYTILNQCGAVPDRLAVNQFITHGHDKSFNQELVFFGLQSPQKLVSEINYVQDWEAHVGNMQYFESAKSDRGIGIYWAAILRWQDVFFKSNDGIKNFATPLLCTQVKPFCRVNSDIVQWAKAYQNLCEIILLCIESFPEEFKDIRFNNELIKLIRQNEELAGLSMTATIFPYAMTAFFSVFKFILNRANSITASLQVACVNQNYFETLSLMENVSAHNKVKLTKVDLLDDIKDIPDVLIADIHPNNAARHKIFQNDVGGWISSALDKNPAKKIILMLDITTNNFSDEVIKSLFKTFASYIKADRLEIFFIQSLAKLMQLGADNFSGGAFLYLGNPQDSEFVPNFNQGLQSKSVFFGFMIRHFQDIIKDYFFCIRENAEQVSYQLRQCFSDQSDVVWLKDDTGRTSSAFSAAQVILNTDEGAVYVAINFDNFFNKYFLKLNKKIEIEKEKAKWVNNFFKILLELAKIRGLPITGRQSFGFSLSNMNIALHTIRFSIGVENNKLLSQYVELIYHFSYGLSKYFTEKLAEFNLNEFNAIIIDTYKAFCQPSCKIDEIPVYEETLNEYGHEEQEKHGVASVRLDNNLLFLDLMIGDAGLETKKEAEIGIQIGVFSREHHVWSYTDLFQLFFNAKLNGNESIYVFEGRLGGFKDCGSVFDAEGSTENKQIKTKIIFDPEFKLITPNQTYDDSNVLVDVVALGTMPVRLIKLTNAEQNKIFTQCVQNEWSLERCANSKCVRLIFGARKPWLDYEEVILELLKAGGLSAVIYYLNSLDLKNLPLLQNQGWQKYSKKPIDKIHKILLEVGSWLAICFELFYIQELQRINELNFRKEIVTGVFQGLLYQNSISEDSPLAASILFKVNFVQAWIWNFNDDFNQWVKKIEKNINEASVDQVRLVELRLTAVMPLIQVYYSSSASLSSTPHSVRLRAIADKIDQSHELKNYLQNLESQLITDIPAFKRGAQITNFLRFYLHYPLSDDKKIVLLELIKKHLLSLLEEWLFNYDFLHDPLDEFDIGIANIQEECDLIVSEDNQEQLALFLKQTGGEEILVNKIECSVERTLKWAIMTNNSTLFNAVLESLKSCLTDINVNRYEKFLKKTDPVQLNIIKALSQPKQLASSSMSPHSVLFEPKPKEEDKKPALSYADKVKLKSKVRFK